MAREIIVTCAFAILLAYLIDPVVRFLQTHPLFFRNLRGPHVLEAYLAFLLCFGLVGHAFAPGAISFISKLLKTAPTVIQGLSTGEIAESIGHKYHWTDAHQSQLKQFLLNHQDLIQTLARNVEHDALGSVAVIVVVPVLSIFFLAEGRLIANTLIGLLSTEATRQKFEDVAHDLNLGFRKYIRAKVTLAAWSFGFYSAVMLLLRFPHPIALAILGGILEFVPVAGWITAAVTIVGVGAMTHSHWIWMAALLGVWRLIMDYYISPRVVGHNLEIHPLLVILAVMVGGEVDGIVGVYLSIPAIVVVRVVWQNYVKRQLQSAPELLTTVAEGVSNDRI